MTGEENRTRFSRRDLLHVIFKRKMKVILFFTATIATVALGTFLSAPTYRATSHILVKLGRENVYVPTVQGLASPMPVINNVKSDEQINSEIEILRSSSLLEEMIEALGPTNLYKHLEDSSTFDLAPHEVESSRRLVGEAMRAFRRDLRVEGIKRSNVIQVSYEHQDPRMAAVVVNRLVDLYMDRHLQVHKNPESQGFFQQQTAILKQKLLQAEDALTRFKQEYNITALEDEISLLLSRNSELGAALSQSISQIAETEKRVASLERQLKGVPDRILEGEEIDNNPLILSTLEQRLVELLLKEKELLLKYKEESRLVANVRDEIQTVRGKLAEQESRRYGKTKIGVNTTYQHIHRSFLENESELKALKARREAQAAQLDFYREELSRLNRLQVALNRLEREVEIDRQNYRTYVAKYEESRISNAMDAERIANVSLIERAQTPIRPVRPRVKMNLALGFFLGAFGGLGLAFLLEYADESLERPEETEEALGLPVLASVPDHRAGGRG